MDGTTNHALQQEEPHSGLIRIQEDWERTFEALPDLILLLDKRHRIVRANKAAGRRLGCTRADLAGRHFCEIIHDTGALVNVRAHARLLSDGQEHHFEIRSESLGGDFAVSVTPVRNKDGEHVGAVYLARDITKLKRVEAELRHAQEQVEQRHALAVAASLDGLWEWEIASETVKYSKRFEELLGYSHEEVPSTLEFFHDILHPDDAEATWDAVDRHWEDRTPFDVEYRLRTKGGEYRWFQARGRTQWDEHCRPERMVGSLQDITDRKNADESRELYVRLLSLANKARSLDGLLSGLTSALQDWSGCDAISIRLYDDEAHFFCETEARSDEFVQAERSLRKSDAHQRLLREYGDCPLPGCMCLKVVRGLFDPLLPCFTTRGSYCTNNASESRRLASQGERRTCERWHVLGYESVALVPLQVAGEKLGLLRFVDRRKGFFSEQRSALFEQLAYSLATSVAQQKAVEALRTSEETLCRQQRSLSEAQRIANLGSWEWNVETGDLSWSDETYRIFGLEPQEFDATAEAFYEAVHPEDRDSVREARERALAEPGSHYGIEHRVVRPDGSERIVSELGDVALDENGQPVRMIGTVQDITELKQTELKLRKALDNVQRLKDRLNAENVYLQEELQGLYHFDEVIGQSESLRRAQHKVEQVAGTDANVLLTGETGTGKELFARAIHNRSRRKNRPLVKVNCAALAPSLIESELFGHIKGAFTGAVGDRTGRFELADGGTLFLDEIGELDMDLQAKLLRVIQEKEFEKIGSADTIHVDIRIIAATNRNLTRAREDGIFREDLYYRLAVFPIEIPPLRERRDDVRLLAAHFVTTKQKKLGKTITDIPREVIRALTAHDWPGNVRELENVIENAVILSPGSTLVLDGATLKPSSTLPSKPLSDSLEDMERAHILRVLMDCDWRIKGKAGAAEQLGMKPSTLRYRLKKLGIKRPAPDKPQLHGLGVG